MPPYMRIKDIRGMTYERLRRWWEEDFDVLVTTAIAEVRAEVDPTVAEALRSDDWLEQWADALYAASGNLASSAERFDFLGDPRQKQVQEEFGLVSQRMGHVNGMLKARQFEMAWDGLEPRMKDARLMALWVLSQCHRDEMNQIWEKGFSRHGLDRFGPRDKSAYKDPFGAIENAVQQGVILVQDNEQVHSLLAMPLHAFTGIVMADMKDQQNRSDELRHPLLLRRWSDVLTHLRDKYCAGVGIDPVFTVTLPRLDVRTLQGVPEEDAWRVLNRRRLIRAIAQRKRECDMRTRELVQLVREEEKRKRAPWKAAEGEACEELASRYPQQVAALTARLSEYCEPGSTRLVRQALDSWQREALIRDMKAAYLNGEFDGPTP